jgi:surface polysaccharide O-acyltransferase-like enzyme
MHKPIWTTIENLRRTSLQLALAGFVVLAVIWTSQHKLSPLELVPYRLLKSFHAWCWILGLLGFGRKYLNRNSEALRYANEAVYPFYILHQTITVALGYYLASWAIHPLVKFAVVAAGTFAGCLMLYEGAIKRFGVLRLVFGLKTQAGRPARTGAEMSTIVQANSPA